MAEAASREDPRPNVLWLCTDQQRYDTLGVTGNTFVHTPNLDRLAAAGVLFDRAYCQNPLCTPSRASFLTGRYPRTTRARENGQGIPADEVLVTRLLADAGYLCGLAGKLHLSPCHPSVCPVTERRIDDGYTEFHWSHHPFPDWPGNEYIHWLHERGVAFGRQPSELTPYVHSGMPAEYHQTTWCATKAVEFIERAASGGRPWLFSFNCFDPHPSFDPPREYLERYLPRLDDIPLPDYRPGELDDKPPHQKRNHDRSRSAVAGTPIPAPQTDRDHRLVRAAYWAMVDLIDAQVGRMLEALDRTGQRANTLVIFMSDHGEMLGDHGLYLKGGYLYEHAVHMPLIVSWPGRVEADRRGSTIRRLTDRPDSPRPELVEGRSRALVEFTDLAPTLLEAAGLDRHPGMQGRSFWPLLTGAAPLHTHREDVYAECLNSRPHRAGGRPPGRGLDLSMVRTDRWKLVVVHGEDVGELYDLEDNPSETHNRWSDQACQGVKLTMLRRLCDRMAWTVDPLPAHQASW